MFSHRVGAPGWKLAARLGVPLTVQVPVRWDDEAKVFVAVSDDFLPEFGCVAESPTWSGLEAELKAVFEDAFETIFGFGVKEPEINPNLRFAS